MQSESFLAFTSSLAGRSANFARVAPMECGTRDAASSVSFCASSKVSRLSYFHPSAMLCLKAVIAFRSRPHHPASVPEFPSCSAARRARPPVPRFVRRCVRKREQQTTSQLSHPEETSRCMWWIEPKWPRAPTCDFITRPWPLTCQHSACEPQDVCPSPPRWPCGLPRAPQLTPELRRRA